MSPISPAERLRAFIASESAGGIILIAAAALALAIANSPLLPDYQKLLSTPVAFSAGSLVAIDKPLLLWINDGLMALFFFLIGLEVKREIVTGQLRSWKQASLPIIAAIGGMAIPAIVFVALNLCSPENLRGWAIPAATDIAFALGLLALLGSRVPVALKALLLAIAIIDDIGAIAIIAIFYTENMNLAALALALIPAAAMLLLNRAGVARTIPYFLFAALLWICVLKSGVHATLAGVVTALFVPIATGEERPLERLEHALHPWVAFLILPIFAFANAGVSFAGAGLDALLAPLSLGIAAGLVIGKQLGIFGACWLAVKAGWARLPEGVSFRHVYGLSCLAGIGFTMSLFIGNLAFADPQQIAAVKFGVLGGSLVSAITGIVVLRFASPRKQTQVAA
ncbi:Na+/H+ antiporter NhaA [Qipengyuania flava]|uniref:Na+/H+ antiporter NhaA n=1 Tax=Qipengyuania flava TaxID=192812 RepID=UPI001C576BEB|nr:Na+/H+ antiporter NhaA [Qipengyuania flava]MBW3168203.1 Na+/H+ antiporter NhaA [Qipengyuania flava]MBY5965441.1 Na+/H+ antiporter NhaA [Qipengyuania flava]MBY6011765.1 Na+/H+ antiporter NhaA [Qipengyuania flava]MBY6026207.1 Na+/H+ antiporter NhaA [Qipengyuania flava]